MPGAVTTRFAYDRHGNKTLDVSAAGLAGLENAVSMRYDAGSNDLRVLWIQFAGTAPAHNPSPHQPDPQGAPP